MKRIATVLVLMVMVAGMAAAYGGGGFFQASSVPVPDYSNTGRNADIVGGFGYGADRGGTRYGGFGLAIHDETDESLVGAFGGVISGSQLRTGPFTVSVNLWTGIGYVNPRLIRSSAGFGYFAEATGEAGFAVLPWLQLSVYGGMQAIGSLDAASIVSSARYAPVVGSRLTWGHF